MIIYMYGTKKALKFREKEGNGKNSKPSKPNTSSGLNDDLATSLPVPSSDKTDIDNPFRQKKEPSSKCVNLEEDDICIDDKNTWENLLPSPPLENTIDECECNVCAVS